MTKDELKNLPNIKIIAETASMLHIHTNKDYILYTIEKFTNRNEDGVEYTDYSISGSNCYYFPVFLEEYPKYSVITKSEYDKLRKNFEQMDVVEKEKLYNN